MTAETPVPTGITALDTFTGGMFPGQLIVIAGRFGHGADVVATHIARTAAITRGIPTVFTSCRRNTDEVMEHLIAAQAGVDIDHLANRKLDDQEKNRIAAASEPVQAAPLFINPERTITQIAHHIAGTHAQLAVVEGAHLLHDEEPIDDEPHRADVQSRALKILARSAGIPVVVSVPLFPRDERPTDAVPMFSDFGYRSPFGADADLAILVHRPELNGQDWRADEIDIAVVKHRNGPVAKFTAVFQGRFDRLLNLPEDYDTPPKDVEP